MKVAVVSCTKKKAKYPCKASEMYYPSPMFRFARQVAQRYDSWVILSAKFGVLLPSTPIEPYEKSVGSMTRAERELWERVCRQNLRERFPGATFVVLCGRDYETAIPPEATKERPLGHPTSMGMMLKRLKALAEGGRT